MTINRRTFLQGLGAAATLAFLPSPSYTQSLGADRKRLIFIFLRGGMDGLDVVAPVNDGNYQDLRGSLARTADNTVDLDGQFALASEMPNLLAQYEAGEALLVPATAGPHRERSHFEAQERIELGVTEGGDNGWLGRLANLIDTNGSGGAEALALGTSSPLSLSGTDDLVMWTTSRLKPVSDRLLRQLEGLYGADPTLSAALDSAEDTNDLVASAFPSGGLPDSGDPAALATAATAFLTAADGPSIAMLDLGGFDTHANQRGAITGPLAGLDGTLASLKTGMGDAWRHTTVVALSEFGRTAFVNGTAGTDHGTGGLTIVTGGAVNGGRIGGIWPGLSSSDLFEERDLAATTDQRAILKTIAADSFSLSASDIENTLFPESGDVEALGELYR